MALNPEKVNFLFDKIQNLRYETFKSAITQLYQYLKTEVKDNPIFDKYESESLNWRKWPELYDDWFLPDDFDDAKYLAYAIYKTIAENDTDWVDDFTSNLFMQKMYIDNFKGLNETFLGYYRQTLDDITNANPEIQDNTTKKMKKDTVFIIHGHDNLLKAEVQLLLNRAGINSVVLHEQADRGRTIIDKLLEETEIAGYAIALLTPDDITNFGQERARQNVIMEIGYFIGKLGKERLRMLVKGNIEVPSDLQGILYEKHGEDGAWKIKLLKEIQSVGIYADMQSVINLF